MKCNSIRASVSNEAKTQAGGRIMRLTSRIARQSVATLLSGLLIFQPMLVQAQVAPDTGAPIGNQPGIGAAPNGVPLVDIVTPNGQGLSHNKYHDFNVGNPGLILNNHNGELGTSKLGGITPGNANLKNSGPASVILNEVTSGNRSALQGATEVFGGRADVIIANPNGITCDGCGFINTPRATLTTGTPDIDGTGRLSGFTVQGGDVTFGSKGGNFASGDGAVDLFDIVSRRVQIDGPVNGKNLRLSAGRQKFNYATGEASALDGADDASEFAIDGSALGAMQADRIKIVVTDKGAGVRMRNDMAANAGELTLSADGKISLGNASGRDGVSIQSKSRQVEAKKVTSKKRVVVKAAKGITLEAVAADEDVVLNSDTGLLSIAGDAASLGNIELTSSGAIVTGNVAAAKNASLRAGQGISAGQINADGAASLTTASGNIALSGTAKAGGDALNITATSGSISAASLVSFKNMALTAGADIATGDILSGGALVASARSLNAGNVVSGVDFAATNAATASGATNGTIKLGSAGDMRLQTAGGVDVASLLSAGNLNLSAASFVAQNVTSHGIVTIAGDTHVSGQLLGSDDVSITGANIKAGAIISGVDFAASNASNGAIVVGNSGDTTLVAQAGTIDVGTLLSAGNLLGNAATFKATNVTTHGTTNISGATAISGQLLSGSDITIKGTSVDLGTAVAGVDLAALANRNVVLANTAHTLDLTATAGNLTAQRLLSSGGTLASATGNLSANATAHGDLNLTAGGTLALSGQSLAGGNAILNAGSINLGTLVSGVDFAATEQAGGSLILKTGNPATGQMSLAATGGATTASGSITADQLLSGGDLKARAQQNISYNSLQSFAAADLNAVLGTISLDKNTVAKGNIALTLQSLDLSNNRSKLATAGTLIVNAASANLANSTLTFGGIALNLSGGVDASGTKLRAVTADGGSGDIAITATTISTTAATALLAANDLTLTLASLTNPGQLAANNNLTFNISGNFTNTATGLVYAGQDGRLYVAGDLLNDQGAILVGQDLTIAANASGARNNSITNISGLIKAERDATIITSNLTNKRLYVPGLTNVQYDPTTLATFLLNPELWDKPFQQLYQGWNDDTEDDKILFPDLGRQDWEDYKDRLWGEAVLADGSSFRAWNWISAVGPVGSRDIRNWIASKLPQDENGNPIIDPNNPSKHFIVNNQGKPEDTSTIYSWDDTAGIRQTIYEDVFDGDAAPEALIRSGRNLLIDATVLTNSYSSIEADGDAVLKGQTLNNEGVVATRKTVLECRAQGACEAYDASGNRDPSKDMANGSSVLVRTETIGQLAGNIKAAGNLDITGFATVNNTSAEGSIAGGAALSTAPNTDDPTSVLDGMTAGGALYTPNAALGGLSANGTPLTGAELVAALGNTAPKPNSGGFGGTIPGQVFLYETRAEFLDVGKFYGSGYFINRIGYNPDRSIPFLGDAYFENQLIDQQLRQLVNQGLGKGSFIPGSDAIEQMKTLLDRGADYAAANGLTIGEKLSPEMIANLTETMVWYDKKTVNGIEVLVPTVYIANADKANLTVAGAIISGGSLNMNVGDVNNSGAIAAKTDLKLAATNIAATGGSFIADNDLSLSATQNITLTAQTTNVGGETVVNPNAMVNAGGNANLAAAETLKLQGAGVDAGGNASLSGRDVMLDIQKVDNNGSQNAVGTRITTGGDLGIKAENDVTVIGSSAKAGGDLNVTAEHGSVNVVTTDVTRKTDDGYTKTTTTTQQLSQLSSGGDTAIKAGQDVLISGSSVKSDGDTSIAAGRNVNITAVQEKESVTFGKNSGESTTHSGSEIAAKGNVSVSAGENGAGNLNIVGSNIAADEAVSLKAADNVTIAEARDSSAYELHNKSGKKAKTDSEFAIETTVGSSVSGKTGVDISSGKDTTISASKVQAGDKDNKADLNINAGGDLIVSSGKDTIEQETNSQKKGFLSKKKWSTEVYDETTVSSDLSVSGNVNLNADRNVVISGSNVKAGENIAIEGDSVSVIGAQEAHNLDQSKKKSGLGAGSGGGFFSIWGKEEKSSDTDVVANVGSSLSAGNDVSIKARESDVNIIGSHVAAGKSCEDCGDIALEAARDVNILPGAESYASEDKERRSGIGIQFSSGNGSASIGIGYGSSKTETRQGAETNATSSLSAGRDVIITAGRDANLQAAQVEAGSTVDILAERDVNLLSAQDKTNYETMHEELFAGITATVSSQAAKAVGNAYDAAKKVGDGNAANSIAMATIAGVNGKYAYDSLTTNENGPLLSTSLGIGFQYQKNSAEGSSSTPVPTTIRAGDTVIVEAGRDINAVGAQISAGYNADGTLSGGRGDIALIAGNDINLESAKATTENSSKNVSGGLSIDFLSPGISASFGQGKGNDTTVTNVNTHVAGSGTVYVNSGNDTNLRGATVSGETVIADVGGDLNIESQLDTATANAKQVGASLGVGSNPSGLTGGLSGSYQTAKGDAAIVSEQSGIHAGEGGFDIKVDGNTKLKGGLITSEADQENNRLETGTLEFEDLDTHSKWKADTYGGGITGSGPIVSPPIKEGESETGKALSAISPGEIVITDPDNQKQNIDDLRRDTTDTNTSLPGIPDLQKLLDEQLKTQQLYDDAAAKAAKMIGDYATATAKAALDNGQLEEYEFWKDGGNGPAILHAIAGGLLGGVTDFSGMLSGMAGGAMSAKLAPEIQKLVAQFVADAGITGATADLMVNSITGSILQGLGAATGGTGAAYAGNAYQNNYLTHKEMEEANAERADLLKQIEECRAGAATTCDGGTLAGLQQQLTDSVAYYQLVSDANNAALVEACAASMTSAACQQGLKDLQNAVDNEYGLQARILGTGAVNTADAILLGVLNDATNGVIPVGQIGTAYQQALLKDQQITNSVGALSLLTAAGILVGPEVYTYCLANAASCTAMVTEAVDCFATVACSASAGIMSAGAAAGLAKQLETAAAESGARAAALPGKTSVYISVADDGTIQYVGITDNFAARAAAHRGQKGIDIDPILGLENISRYDARAVEQVLIETYRLSKDGGSLMNMINSIAKTNPKYAAALLRGNALLKAVNYPGF